MLFAEYGAPPVGGMTGWLITFGIGIVLSIGGNIWTEYRRRCEVRDNLLAEEARAKEQKEAAKSMAEVQSDQERTRLEFESVKNVIAMYQADAITMRAAAAAQNEECNKLRASYSGAMAANQELLAKLEKVLAEQQQTLKELQEAKDALGKKDKEIQSLKARLSQLEKEVKSLEESRDAAIRACPSKDAGK